MSLNLIQAIHIIGIRMDGPVEAFARDEDEAGLLCRSLQYDGYMPMAQPTQVSDTFDRWTIKEADFTIDE